MPDNINDETSSNLSVFQTLNISGENNSANVTDAMIPNQKNENMEVHHHPDVHHKPKKWKEYFLEFLMIFLAVTMGFFAESFREHRVNKEIERQNIVSLVRNLLQDSSNLSNLIETNKNYNLVIDSLCKIPGAFSDTLFQKSFFNYAAQLTWVSLFNSQNSTFQQMQSSGTMRLINNPYVRDRILEYEALNDYIKGQAAYVEIAFKASSEDLSQMTDARSQIKNMPLRLIGDSQNIQRYLNHKISQQVSIKTYVAMLQYQLANARAMIHFFKKEYNIDENINSIYDENEFVAVTPLQCETEQSLKSLNADMPTLLRIKNNTSERLTVYWINYLGQRDLNADQIRHIEIGKIIDQKTFVTHPFVVTGSTGKCYGVYTAESIPSIAIIKN